MNKHKREKLENLYINRKPTELHPDIERKDFQEHLDSATKRPDDTPRIERYLKYLSRLIDLNQCRNIVVIGCGLMPQTVKILMEKKYNVTGIEPVSSFVRSAAEYLGSKNIIIQGTAENIPLPDASQHIAFCESVLEHVDSPTKTLAEVYRVLTPGGIVFINTTNRYQLTLMGKNAEFRIRYFNWFPRLVKECIIFHQQHYKPILAEYSERPAVHWYSYSDLCKLGRDAGFSHFYSFLDLVRTSDDSISKSKVRKLLLNTVKLNPWLRALFLAQHGGSIIMYKRKSQEKS